MRQPLAASRTSVLTLLLQAHADREQFLHILGIHSDSVGRSAGSTRPSETRKVSA